MDAESRRARLEEVAPGVVEPLRRFLVRRTDPTAADAVLRDTLLVCWRRIEQVPDDPLPWVYAVARHCLAHTERDARPRGDRRATDALGALRPADAEVLRLWAWERLGPAEIAVVLGTRPSAASARLQRAQARLGDRLGDRGEDLRRSLQAADPAASLAPAGPALVADLLAETSSHEPPAGRAGRRSPLTYLLAAAALVVIAAVALLALTGPLSDARDPAPVVGDGDTGSGPAGAPAGVVELTAGTEQAGRCMAPDPRLLARQDTAFEGIVESVDDSTVVLVPTRFYAGEEAGRVEVVAPAPEMSALLGAVPFEEGQAYLVAADDGRVALCGLSGPAGPRLARLYAEAFAG